MDLIRAEGAVLWREAEAKLADTRWPTVPTAINPHHLTTARGRLLSRGWIRLSDPFDASGTRFMIPTDVRGKKELIREASKRKRLLHRRMERWARATSRYRSGIVGEAGERVTLASLDAAATRGTRPVTPGAREIGSLFGEPVPGGPLDSAAWAEQLDDYGRSTDSVLCPIEVKNIRHWIYPSSHELFQLLHKSALLQQDYPDLAICPVLITRKRSWTADQMSRDLGFRIVDIHKQFLLPIAEVPAEQVDEIRSELGYADLIRSDSADPTLTALLGGSVRTTSAPNAEQWLGHGSRLFEHYEALRNPGLNDADRADAMNELRDAADDNGSYTRAW